MRHLRVFWFKGIFGVVDKSLLEKEGSKARSTLKELVSDEYESKGSIISTPKGRLIPSVPSRLDISSNDSKLGLLGWLGRSECGRGYKNPVGWHLLLNPILIHKINCHSLPEL